MTTPILEMSGVRAGYGIIDVLHGVDLTVMPGEVFALFGPNGAGKSTTLRVASGQIAPSGGSVKISGREVNGVRPHALAKAGVCLIPEGRGVFPNLTVNDNLRMWARSGTPYRVIAEKSFHYFPRLHERRNQLAGTLSGGEQQMLAVGRALMSRPKLMMMDEPSLGLAPLVVKGIFDIIKEINKQGVTILLIEQNANMALHTADMGYVLETGRITLSGPGKELLKDEAVKRAYLGK